MEVLVRALCSSVLGSVLLALPTCLPAQAVDGEVRERLGQMPVEGAFVILQDELGTEKARALTGQHGRFLLRASSPGTYRLVVKRVGFVPHHSERFILDTNRTTTHRLVVDAIPIDLSAVVVRGDRQCDISDRRRGAALTALWEQIHEALTSVAWTTREPGYWFALRVSERDLTPGRRVLRELSVMRAGEYQRPFVSAPDSQLSERGYIVAQGDKWVYFAPDADVLLGAGFLRSHCFDVVVGKGDRTELVGLAFQPAPSHKVPDVQGTLWVDRRTAELRSLEYEYVQLPAAAMPARSGGRMSFLHLPSGAWIVKDWLITMPRGGIQRGPDPAAPVALREAGGRVLQIKRADGSEIYSADLAILEGTVFDSIHGNGLAEALVSIAGTDHTTRTNPAGFFRITAPLEGQYGVMFEHPRLDSIGYRPPETPVELRALQTSRVSLAIPSTASVIAILCPDTVIRITDRIIIGVVRSPSSGRAVPGADVRASWQVVHSAAGVIASTDLLAIGRADQAGGFRICGVPLDRAVTLQAGAGGTQGKPVQIRFLPDGVAFHDTLVPMHGRIWKLDLEGPSDQMVAEAPTTAVSDSSVPRTDVLLTVGFYERRRAGAGYFLTREQFSRSSPHSASSVLMMIPVLRATIRGGRRIIELRRGRASLSLDCTPSVLVDGNQVGSTGEIDVDATVPVMEIAGIEVYTGGSQVPARFGATGTACGLIAIWTR